MIRAKPNWSSRLWELSKSEGSTLIGRDLSKHCPLIDCDHDGVADASSLTQ